MILPYQRINSGFTFPVNIVAILLVIQSFVFSQSFDFLTSAEVQMEAGKYSEAIELLNNYISINPRKSDGYAKRAECFENTGQQYNAVLDWEKALSVDPQNQELNQRLTASRNKLNSELDIKIKGHERELAIDPEAAENYLAIGKACMQKEEYEKAAILLSKLNAIKTKLRKGDYNDD